MTQNAYGYDAKDLALDKKFREQWRAAINKLTGSWRIPFMATNIAPPNASITGSVNPSINGTTAKMPVPLVIAFEDVTVPKGTVMALVCGSRTSLPTFTPPKDDNDLNYIVNSMKNIGTDISEIYMHPDDYAVYSSSGSGYRMSNIFNVPQALTWTYQVLPLPPTKNVIIDDFEIVETKARVCECGSAKCNLPFHSSWCPMSEKT